MCQPLPVRNFEWMGESESWREVPCILEVDLEYPEELHDLRNNYPLVPENVRVDRVERLIPNLNDRFRYLIHHRNVKLYLALWMRLTKIYRGIKFVEKLWLKSYIEKNTELRKGAGNSF